MPMVVVIGDVTCDRMHGLRLGDPERAWYASDVWRGRGRRGAGGQVEGFSPRVKGWLIPASCSVRDELPELH